MNRTIRITVGDTVHSFPLSGSVPSDPITLKVMIANYLDAPPPDSTIERCRENLGILVDSRLAAAGVTGFEVLDV